MENATSILFGLPGVAVERVERIAKGRLVHVVTAVPSAAGCPECGVASTSVKQYRTTRPRDLPYGEEPLAVRWHKRQYRCREAACPRSGLRRHPGRAAVLTWSDPPRPMNGCDRTGSTALSRSAACRMV